jgi:hypothetical protein
MLRILTAIRSFMTCIICGSAMYQDDRDRWCCPKCDD